MGNRRSTMSLLAMVMVLLLLTTACGGNSSNSGAGSSNASGTSASSGSAASTETVTPKESITIRIGHANTDTHSFHIGMEQFKKNVEERTNGEIKVEILANGALGENKDVLEQAKLGGTVIAQFNPGNMGEYYPDYGILSGPFLFENWDEAKKVLNSDLVKGWEEDVASSAGLRVLGYFNFGVRDLYTIDRPVRTPSDMAGLKVRVQSVKMFTEMISAMGGNPTPMPWTEVYTALSQKAIDGVEAPPNAIYDMKHHEHAKYLMLDDHMLDISLVAMSEKVYAGLSEENRQIINEEMTKALDEVSAMIIQQHNEYIDKLEAEGMTIVRDVDREAFKEAVKDVYTKFPEWTPGLYEKIQEILNQ